MRRRTYQKAPDWRWRRAVDLVDSESRPTRKDDAFVTRAWRFLRKKRKSSVAQVVALEDDYPDLYYANKIYEEETEFRWMLESALCTPASYEEIAKHGYDVDEIEAYEKLFWDIRDKLDSSVYVQTHILNPALHNRTADVRSPDFISKTIALVLGYTSLVDFKRKGNESVVLQKFARIERENQLRWNGLETAYTVPSNRYNAVETLQLCMDMDKADDERGQGSKEGLVESVAQLLEAVQFRKRKATDNILDEDGGEPRALANSEITFDAEKGSSSQTDNVEEQA